MGTANGPSGETLTVMGHEASGVVEAVGAGVTRVKPGNAISLESHIYCGECHQCLTD